jgi:DNA-binding winged helix-turn-helix (wHTH) protein/tetratricopeptide (TPR) repeat protein
MRESAIVSFLQFTFDLASGDLRRDGGRQIRMPEQSIRLLAILIERAGTVVYRDELQQLLWPEGEFLDHEHAINRIVTQLRSVLRDDPRKPRYVETVRKRGYRFLPPVTVIASENAPEIELAPQANQYLPAEDQPASAAIEAIAPPDLGLVIGPDAQQIPHPARQNLAARMRARFIVRIAVVGSAATILLVATSIAIYHYLPWRAQPEVNAISLGITPFQSDGPGAEQTGESFRLDLADALSQLPAVQVRATNSLTSIGRDDNSLRMASDKLHLDMFLLGRLRVQGDRCIVQFELVRSRDFLHLASFQYEGGKDELAIIRNKFQRDLFLRLQGKSKSAQAIRGSTDDSQAYSEYLVARELTQVRDPTALNQALGHYQRAIQLDPKFAQAYSGMATVHLSLRYFNPADHQKQAQQLANAALKLDPDLAEAHGVLGDVAFRADWNFRLGEIELRRAVELEPQVATYHAWLAGLLADEGRFSEAMPEIDRAIADDPLWPSVYSMEAFVDGAARDDTRMIAAVHKYLSLVPDSAYTHDQMAWAYFSAKRYDEALAEWRRMAEIEKDSSRIALEDRGRQAYRRGGIQAYARVHLEAIEQHTIETTRHPNDFIPSEWYAFAGQPNKALPSLEQAVAVHDGEAVQLAINPMFDNLHDNPRFQSLLRQVGLTLPNDPRHNLRSSR